MKSEFSEFSYGYALLDELINWYGSPLVAAPDFPTTVAEARKGYDAKLSMSGFALFLQFKASDCMVWKSALETKLKHFYPPFFRMHLRRMSKSKQHEVLLQLEKERHFVFYVAPGFHRTAELNQAYFSRNTSLRSIWIRPSEIGRLPDNKNHHVSFRLPKTFIRYSEPKHLQGRFTFDSLKERLQERTSAPDDSLLTEERVTRLETYMIDLINENIAVPGGLDPLNQQQFPDNIRRLSRISYLAKIFLDCELLICKPK